LRENLGPNLNKGDVVVLDGASIHKVKEVEEVLNQFGASALYLPPYSPELNPIEMTWAWLKQLLRKNPARKIAALKKRLQLHWQSVTQEFCQNWIGHCGYCSST